MQYQFDILADFIGWIFMIKACNELMRYDAHKVSGLKTVSTIALIINVASYAFGLLRISLLSEILLFGVIGVFATLILELAYLAFTIIALYKAIHIIAIMQEMDDTYYFAEKIKSKFMLWIVLNISLFLSIIIVLIVPTIGFMVVGAIGVAGAVVNIMLLVNVYRAKKAYEMHIQGV